VVRLNDCCLPGGTPGAGAQGKTSGAVAKQFCNTPAWYYEQYSQPTAHAAERRKARLAAA